MPDQPSKLSEADLLLIQSAHQGLQSAQTVFEFARNHVSRVYGLGQMDQFNMLTGEITRVNPDQSAAQAAVGKEA